MKVSFPCPTCHPKGTREYEYELTNELKYELTCEKGHKVTFILKNKSFELLFEMGLYALQDGYAREAVTNFAAAIERFHEFCIRVLSHEFGIDEQTKIGGTNTWMTDRGFGNEYKKAWNELSRQSERQLGAFVALYLVAFKRSPVLMSNKDIEFRNNITHKGVFPTYDQALKYAQTTFQYIQEKLIELKEKAPNAVEYVNSSEWRELKADIDKINGKTIAAFTMDTTFQSDKKIEDLTNATFENALKSSYRFFLP